MSLCFTALEGIPEIRPGDDLAHVIAGAFSLQQQDVVVVTSKVVSKAAGLATTTEKDNLLAAEADRLVAERAGTRIVRTHHGLTMAAAGIDASNTRRGTLLPLPRDPDADAAAIRRGLLALTGRDVAVVISDTAGRAWRNGQTDIAIGCAGLVPMDSFAGRVDDYGNPLVVTAPAVADEIAGAAELVSGKLGGCPVVVARGVHPHLLVPEDGEGATSLIRPEDADLFGLGAREAVLASLAGEGVVRGFATTDVTTSDLVLMARPPEELEIAVTGSLVRVSAPAAHLVAAGAFGQRLVAIAVAHATTVEVDVVATS